MGRRRAGVEPVTVQDARSLNIGDRFFDPRMPPSARSTITWTNNGALPHAVTADDGSFDSGVLNPGDSYTVAFDEQGTVTYFCAVHPEMRAAPPSALPAAEAAVLLQPSNPLARTCPRLKIPKTVISRLLTFSWYLLSGGAKALALFHGLVTSEFPRRLSFSASW